MESVSSVNTEHRITKIESQQDFHASEIERHDKEISEMRELLKTITNTIQKQSVSSALLWQIVKSGIWVIGVIATIIIGYLATIILPKI